MFKIKLNKFETFKQNRKKNKRLFDIFELNNVNVNHVNK